MKKLEYYVLHYDIDTLKYLNEIKLTTFDIAVRNFIATKQYNKNDRIELIYSPSNKLHKTLLTKGAI